MNVPMLPMPMMCIRRVRSCSVGSSEGKFRVPELDDGAGSSGIGSAPSTPPHHDCWADTVRNGLQASRHSSILSWKHFAYVRCVGNSTLFRGAQKYFGDSLEVRGVRVGKSEASVGGDGYLVEIIYQGTSIESWRLYDSRCAERALFACSHQLACSNHCFGLKL